MNAMLKKGGKRLEKGLKSLLFMEGLKHKSKFIAATSQVSLQQTPTV